MEARTANFTSPFGEQALAAWTSEEFVAATFKCNGAIRLSVARADFSERPLSWEELMEVKRDCGLGEFDAVEIYPADSDVFNTGNVRHLFFVGQLPFALRRNTHTLQ